MVDQVQPNVSSRVLFVNTRDDLGADVAVHLLLARHLRAAGVKAIFTVNSHASAARKMLAELDNAPDVEVVALPLGRPVSGHRGFARARAWLGNLAVLWSLCRLAALVWREGVSVLHTTDRPRDALVGVLLGSLTGRPTIVHMHSNYHPSMSAISRWAFARCTCVLGISDFTTRSMLAAGVPPERLATVLNALDGERYDPDAVPKGQARARWAIPADAPLIALVGRLMVYKGHKDLLDALAAGGDALATTHLLIVGDDAGGSRRYAEALRARAAALGIADRVHFTGVQQDVRPIYADLDVLVVPSWEEPFGLVAAEAMAMRVPVLAYRSGGIQELVRSGEDGILVAPRAIAELADALVRLVNDPQLRTRLGIAGRQRVLEQFTPARQAAEAAALYQRLASNNGRVARVAPAAH